MKFLENIKQKIKETVPVDKIPFRAFWKRWWLSFVTGIVAFIICFCFLTTYFHRSYAIGVLKNQFEELEKNLQSVGYDFAYDELRFSVFSPWQIMRAKNFRIYSLDERDFWQWNMEEFSIDVGLWNVQKVGIYLGRRHTLQIGKREWPVYIEESDVRARLKKGAFKEFLMSIKDLAIRDLLTIDTFQARVKHQHSPFAYAKVDVKGVTIDDMTGWPLNKKLSHFYLDTSLQGDWDSDVPASEAFYEWVDKGGYFSVSKMILNWKPLIMVANGNIHFNENADPTVSLNTASLALLETLDKMNDNNFLSKKGVFVVKLLLNNKAIQQSPTDEYKTIVTPLKISKDAVLLENIKIK